MEKDDIIPSRVCVVGASGRIGSLLVKKLLERGHTVHATVRNLRDAEKTALLKSLPGADSRLFLFEVDLFRLHGHLEAAIQGCHFVFLVAFPTRPLAESFLQGDAGAEALQASLLATLGACERSGTVRRLIYTGSVTAASLLDGDGRPSKDFVDESCWTPPDAPIDYPHDFVKLYACSKTAAEKLLTSYGDDKDGGGYSSLEVVVLTCGMTGGWAIVDATSGMRELVSPVTGDTVAFGALTFLQRLLSSVPLVHQDDVCEAHVFCMGVPLTHGRRFLCASAYPTLGDIIAHYRLRYPDLAIAKVPEECRSWIKGGSTRLKDMGFEYKYGMEQILEDSIQFAKKVGLLKDG